MSTENNLPKVTPEFLPQSGRNPIGQKFQEQSRVHGEDKCGYNAPRTSSRFSLFSEPYQPRVTILDPKDRENCRVAVGLPEVETASGGDYQIKEPAVWRTSKDELDPTIVYDWAMTFLGDKESVYGVIMGTDRQPRKVARTVRYGFRLTRFTEFVEGVIWEQDTITTLRCGIIEQAHIPRQVSITGVNVDEIDVRRDQGYFRLDRNASKSWMLMTTSAPDVTGEEWIPNGTEVGLLRPLHVGSFVRATKFRQMDWDAIVQRVKKHYKGRASESIIVARLEKAEQLISDLTNTTIPAPSQLPVNGKISPQRTQFWSRVWRKFRSVDLPDAAGFVSHRSLQTIDQGMIETWNAVTQYSTLFTQALEAPTPILDPLAGIDTLAQRYAGMILEVRDHLRIASAVTRS